VQLGAHRGRVAVWDPVRRAGRHRKYRDIGSDRQPAAVPARWDERLHRQRAALRCAGRGTVQGGAEESDVMTRRSTRNPPNTQKRLFQRILRALRLTSCVVLFFVSSSDAQPAARRATNLATLLAYPGFFHGRPIVIVGKVAVEKDQLRISDDNGSKPRC